MYNCGGYCIAQNFGRVNFWRLVARHAIGGENFGKSSTTGLSHIVYMITFKNLVGKILVEIFFLNLNFPPPKFRYLSCQALGMYSK